MMSRYEQLAQKLNYHNTFTPSVSCNKYSTAKSVSKKVVWLKCHNVTKAREGIPLDHPPQHLSQNPSSNHVAILLM
jgi:hypothetical protein